MIVELRHPWLVAGVISFLMASAIYVIGNPHINSFYLHWLPEMFCLYFFGAWAAIMKWRFSSITVMYISSVIVPALFVYEKLYWNLIVSLLIGSPLILGYVISLKVENREA